MFVVCDVCRQKVYVSGGYLVLHGQTFYGNFIQCAGSFTRVGDCSTCSD